MKRQKLKKEAYTSTYIKSFRLSSRTEKERTMHRSIEKVKKKGKDTMMRSKVEGRGGGMRGECPVACEKWGSDASREATSRRGVGVGEKGLISTASPIRVFQLRVAVLSYIQDSLPVYNCKENILKHYIENQLQSVSSSQKTTRVLRQNTIESSDRIRLLDNIKMRSTSKVDYFIKIRLFHLSSSISVTLR